MFYCLKSLILFVRINLVFRKRHVAGYGEYTCVHYPIKFPKHEKIAKSLAIILITSFSARQMGFIHIYVMHCFVHTKHLHGAKLWDAHSHPVWHVSPLLDLINEED